MSSSKRKITMSSSRRSRSMERDRDNDHSNRQPSQQQTQRSRPSVFSRLGTKKSPASGTSAKPRGPSETLCRNIIETGSCSYGKNCKYVHSHKIVTKRDHLKLGLKPKRRDSPNIEGKLTML